MSGEFLEPLEFYQANRMDKMNPGFVDKFVPMAQEFYHLTGRPLRVTDTFRTYDEQADLKRRKPNLAAHAGKSRHETGDAMDINIEDIPDIERLGLLEKYGFHRPVLHKGETWHIELQKPGMLASAGKKVLDLTSSPAEAASKGKGGEFLGPLEDTPSGEYLGPLDEKPSFIQSAIKNITQPDNTEFDPYAQPSEVAGAAIKKGIETAQDAIFYPLHKALTLAHKNIIEPVRQKDITSQAGGNIPAPGMAAPEAFAPLAEEKSFVPAMEFALAPAYFKLIGRAGQVLGKYGKQGFYKYAPDWMFRQGEAGLPEVLPPERISQIIGGMSGEERAAAARKYPEFRDVLNEWQMGGKVPDAAMPAESGATAIGRPQVAGELAEPQLKLPDGQGFEVRNKTIRRSVEPTEYPGDYLAVDEKPLPTIERFLGGKRVEGKPLSIPGLAQRQDSIQKAIDNGNLSVLIKDQGGFSIPDTIKNNFEPEEIRRLAFYAKKEGQKPDELLSELKSVYPGVFDKYDTGTDLIRGILDGEMSGQKSVSLLEKEHLALEAEKEAEQLRLDKITRSQEALSQGAEPKLSKKEIDSFWDDVDSGDIKKYYAGLPATEFLQWIGKKLPGISNDLKYPAKVIVGSKLGALSRRGESFAYQTNKFLTMMDKEGAGNTSMPLMDNPGMTLASDLSTGRPLTGWKKEYSALRDKAYSERLDLLEKEGVPLENVKDNYFPGMWTQDSRKAFNQAVGEWISQNGEPPNGDLMLLGDREVKQIHDRVKELISGKKGIDKSALAYISKRPLKGRESFRKSKFFTDDIMDAVKFGLEPNSTNPIVLDRLKMAEIDRNIMAYQVINEFKSKGMIEFNPATARVPEGKAKISDPFGEVVGPPEPGVYGKVIKGYWIADQAVADVLNNYLSNTLYNNRYVGKPFSIYMGIGNSLNQFQLGMGSFFHGGFTSLETQITTGAEVLKDIYGVVKGKRNLSDLGKTLKEYPVAMGLTPYRGYKLMQEWLAAGADIPTDIPVGQLMAQHSGNPYPILAKAAELAGGGFSQEKGLQTEQSEMIVRDWYGGKKLKAAARSPIAFSELLAKPLLKYWVPAQKAGVFAELVGKIIEANPGKTLEELSSEFRQKWNRTDARLGQVRYNRLFVHNYGKNIVQALVRAPGWSGGTLAEVGGAPKDAIEFVNEWQKTGKAPNELPDRVAYVLSLLATTAAVNGLLTYALTGEQPHGMDWWAFRDGGKDLKGRPTRFFVPSYAKDLLAYFKRPVHTILAKMHPIISLLNDVYKGTDYFSNQFRNPEDGWLQQGFDTGKFILKQYIPFWVRNVQQSSKGKGGLSDPVKTVISNIGIAPAPGKLSNTPDMDVIDSYTERFGTRIKSKEDAAKIEKKRDLRDIRLKEGDKAFRDKLQESQRSGEITQKERQGLIKEARTPADISQFKKAPLEVQIRAYNVAPPERQKVLRQFVIQKYSRSQPEEKRKFREEFRKIVSGK